MHRGFVSVVILLGMGSVAIGQKFEHYRNKVLMQIEKEKDAKKIDALNPDLITDYDQVIPGSNAVLIVVKTKQGRYSKLLVQSARQKVDGDTSLPVLYILKFVTYREGTEQARVAQGEKILLFPGFRLNLDLGQVVPPEISADLIVKVKEDQLSVTPGEKSKLFLVMKPLKSAAPKNGSKLVIGENFEPRYFNGKFKLYDDGRRSGVLHLKVAKDLTVSGAYYSDRDGRKYEVRGRIGNPQHSIEFIIKLPRTEQVFEGWLFTEGAKVIAGKSRMVKQQAGFYAVRMEED